MAIEHQPIVFGKFKGIDNKHDIAGFEYLSVGSNVDIDSSKRVRRRKGYRASYIGNTKCLWSNGTTCLFQEGSALKSLNNDLISATTLTPVNGLTTYLSALGNVYISDGQSNFVLEDGSIRQWGVDSPPQPLVSSVSGSLTSGRYMVCLTYVMLDGRESGASNYSAIDATSAISISSIVQPASGFVRVYITNVGGDVFYRVAELKNGETTVKYNGALSDIKMSGQFLTPLPAGHLICYYKGRIYIAQDNIIWYSEAYQPERCNRAFNYITMNGRVSMMMPVDDGIFVADGEAHFLSGNDPKEFKRTMKLPYNAIEGTAKEIDAKYTGSIGMGIVFTSERGICVGSNGGNIKNITEDAVAFKHGRTGSGLVRRINGMIQYVSLINGDDGSAVNTYNPQIGQIQNR